MEGGTFFKWICQINIANDELYVRLHFTQRNQGQGYGFSNWNIDSIKILTIIIGIKINKSTKTASTNMKKNWKSWRLVLWFVRLKSEIMKA